MTTALLDNSISQGTAVFIIRFGRINLREKMYSKHKLIPLYKCKHLKSIFTVTYIAVLDSGVSTLGMTGLGHMGCKYGTLVH